MKKTQILFFAILFFAVNSRAQDGSVRALPDFDAIIFNATGNIVINQGEVHAIRLDGDESSKSKAIIEVRNGKLEIDKLSHRNTAYITFVNIQQIELNGTGSAKSEGIIKSANLKIESNGTGRGEFTVEATDINVDLSGVGSITLNGTANKINADISGTGSIKASDLVVSKANADISGIGSMYIDVRDELAVDISGKGSVRYVTPPKVINKDISGLGKVGDKKNSVNDTTRITIGGSEIIIIDKKDSSDFDLEDQINKRKNKNSVKPFWGGLEMGFNGYLNADNKTSMPEGYKFLELNESKSLAVNVNLFQTKINLEKDHLWLVSGLGLGYNNYRFAKRNFKLAPEVDMVTAITDSANAFNFDKSKLVATYVTVPLLIQVNTSKSKRNNFHLSTGGIFGYKIGSHTKYLTKNGSRKKEKERDDFNLEPIRLDATLRVGYKNFNLFANYAVTELFKDGEGPELHPYTIGLTIIGW